MTSQLRAPSLQRCEFSMHGGELRQLTQHFRILTVKRKCQMWMRNSICTNRAQTLQYSAPYKLSQIDQIHISENMQQGPCTSQPMNTHIYDVLTMVPVTSLFLSLTREVMRNLSFQVSVSATYLSIPYAHRSCGGQLSMLVTSWKITENYLCTDRVMAY
jgi:hypothetical protein